MARFAVVAMLVSVMGAACTTVSEVSMQPPPRGLIVPLYVYPDYPHERDGARAAWRHVADAARAYPDRVMVVVNPANGPGERRDPNYEQVIQMLDAAGAHLIAYVPLTYGERARSAVRRDLVTWRRLYPRIEGVFFDELPVPASLGARREMEAYVAETVAIARETGFDAFVVGNAGVPVPWSYVRPGRLDAAIVHEDTAWPADDRWERLAEAPGEVAARFGVLVYGDGVRDMTRFERVAATVGLMFVNDHSRDVTRAGAYPWNYLPDDLTEQLEILSRRPGPR